MTGRLLLIELRRNVGPWFVPVILLVSWWLLSAWGWVAILWSSTDEQLQASVVPFAAPAMAGAAAWMAGRDRRRGIEDLITTTPASPTRRAIALWAATAAWGVLAYVIFASLMMGRTALTATWGGPDPWRVIVVVTAILACSAWGFLFGTLVPSRFTAPVVAIGTLIVLQFLSGYTVTSGGGYSPTWITYLAPDKSTYELAPWQALLYAGLTGAALAALPLRRSRATLRWVVLGASAMMALVGAGTVWAEWPRYDPDRDVMVNAWGRELEYLYWQPEPTPVCAGAPVSVCIHPQYQPVLRDAVVDANRLAEPLLELPGVPLRAGPGDVWFSGGGTTSLLEVGSPARLDVTSFSDRLVADPESMPDGIMRNEAQIALRSWLLQHTGFGDSWWICTDTMPSHGYPGEPTRQTCEAATRFESLPEADQRAWLERHYAELRAGNLTIADLP